MKKILIAGIMVCTMAVGALAVYADSVDKNKFPSKRGYGHMMTMDNRWDREINFNNQETQEEANERRRHFDEMDKFHKENGFSGGHCRGGNIGGRYGRGMMDRNRY